MKKISFNHSVTVILAGLLGFLAAPAAVAAKDELLWKSGPVQYIGYAEQDTARQGANDHPAELDPRQIAAALEALQFRSEDFFATDDELEPVFSLAQARRLAEQLARGLKRAEPDQDIIFALEKNVTKLLVLTDQVIVSGRAFFKDGKLNIIIGDYDKYRNDELERVYDSSGQVVPYFFNHGSRTDSSGNVKGNLANIPGIDNKVVNNNPRQDWFVIDVRQAATAVAEQRREAEQGGGPDSAATRQMRLEAARMKKEQRELKLEMARMREQMKSMNGSGSADGKTVEERMATLDKLRDEGLISEEEYAAKREEILGDI